MLLSRSEIAFNQQLFYLRMFITYYLITEIYIVSFHCNLRINPSTCDGLLSKFFFRMKIGYFVVHFNYRVLVFRGLVQLGPNMQYRVLQSPMRGMSVAESQRRRRLQLRDGTLRIRKNWSKVRCQIFSYYI